MAITIDEYQHFTVAVAADKDLRDTRTAVVYALGLVGEFGEVGDVVKKVLAQGHNFETSREKLFKELGDVLWYVSMAAHQLNVTLSSIAGVNDFDEMFSNNVFEKDSFTPFQIGQFILEAEPKLSRFVKHLYFDSLSNSGQIDTTRACYDLTEFFYAAVELAICLGFKPSDVAQANYDKLMLRFPGGIFSVDKSVNRSE
jgi:NTP pyrophosphatase (non-canonical NTP hydrolase)